MIGSDWEVAPDILYTKYPKSHKKSVLLSGCKINQIMESGDIIYFILLLFFVILGFFNDSRKKKNMQQQNEKGSGPFIDDSDDEPILRRLSLPKKTASTTTTPPAPPVYVRPEFRSSLDLVTDFEGVSSLKGSLFVHDDDDSFAQDAVKEYDFKEDSSKNMSSLHPLVAELAGEAGEEALKRGLIYGEIMLRKY